MYALRTLNQGNMDSTSSLPSLSQFKLKWQTTFIRTLNYSVQASTCTHLHLLTSTATAEGAVFLKVLHCTHFLMFTFHHALHWSSPAFNYPTKEIELCCSSESWTLHHLYSLIQKCTSPGHLDSRQLKREERVSGVNYNLGGVSVPFVTLWIPDLGVAAHSFWNLLYVLLCAKYRLF